VARPSKPADVAECPLGRVSSSKSLPPTAKQTFFVRDTGEMIA